MTSGGANSSARDNVGGANAAEPLTGHTVTLGNASGLTTGSASGTSSSGSSLGFARFSVIWIQSDGTTDIPTNAVAYSNQGSVPAGWTAYANGINAYLRGAAVGADGGTSTSASSHNHTYSHNHTHSTGSHTHAAGNTSSTVALSSSFGNSGADQAGTTDNHSHASTGTSASATHGAQNTSSSTADADSQTPEPSYYKLQTVQATGAAAAPGGIIALWTTTSPPTGWVACDGTSGTPNINGFGGFIKGANGTGEIGNTGGSNTHTHSGTHSHNAETATAATHAAGTIALSNHVSATSITMGSSGSAAAAKTHGHSGSTTGNRGGTTSSDAVSYSSADHQPAYVNMFFIMRATATAASLTLATTAGVATAAATVSTTGFLTLGQVGGVATAAATVIAAAILGIGGVAGIATATLAIVDKVLPLEVISGVAGVSATVSAPVLLVPGVVGGVATASAAVISPALLSALADGLATAVTALQSPALLLLTADGIATATGSVYAPVYILLDPTNGVATVAISELGILFRARVRLDGAHVSVLRGHGGSVTITKNRAGVVVRSGKIGGGTVT